MKSTKTHASLKQKRIRSGWPIMENIEACAAQIGAAPSLLKAVKRNGSKAFLPGNRIDTSILLPDLFALLAKGGRKLPAGINTPQDWLATEKARREELKRKQDEGELIDIGAVTRQAAEAGGYFMDALERLVRELPPVLAGLSAPGVASRLEHEIESIRRELKIKMGEIGK